MAIFAAAIRTRRAPAATASRSLSFLAYSLLRVFGIPCRQRGLSRLGALFLIGQVNHNLITDFLQLCGVGRFQL
ncbi:hypothetical protein [Rahnella inusitata]|jgi:hypothetical protein|uniref:hypothetical protein n=1 Tax=Rahnella inusitata TaxID=58169 RepID=UPI0039B0ACCA